MDHPDQKQEKRKRIVQWGIKVTHITVEKGSISLIFKD